MTVTVVALGLLRVSVSASGVEPLLPSAIDDVAALNCTVGVPSLSRIVPMPCEFATVALVGLLRWTKNVSVGSLTLSSVVPTVNVCEVVPAAMVTVCATTAV